MGNFRKSGALLGLVLLCIAAVVLPLGAAAGLMPWQGGTGTVVRFTAGSVVFAGAG
jgi:hypothetical protein